MGGTVYGEGLWIAYSVLWVGHTSRVGKSHDFHLSVRAAGARDTVDNMQFDNIENLDIDALYKASIDRFSKTSFIHALTTSTSHVGTIPRHALWPTHTHCIPSTTPRHALCPQNRVALPQMVLVRASQPWLLPVADFVLSPSNAWPHHNSVWPSSRIWVRRMWWRTLPRPSLQMVYAVSSVLMTQSRFFVPWRRLTPSLTRVR